MDYFLHYYNSLHIKGKVKYLLSRSFMPYNKQLLLNDILFYFFDYNLKIIKKHKMNFLYDKLNIQEIFYHDNKSICTKIETKNIITKQSYISILKYTKKENFTKINYVTLTHKNKKINISLTLNNINQLISKKVFCVKKNIYVNTFFKYDKHNRLIEKNIYKKDSLFRVIVFYDKNNRIIKQVNYKNNNIFSEEFFEYNSLKDLTSIQKIEFLPNNFLFEKVIFKYKYDKYNNWIKKTQINNNLTTFVTNRKIIYK